MADALHIPGTLGGLPVAAIARYGPRLALLSDGRTLCYAELGRRIGQAIALFEALGLRRGDAVAQLSGNRAEVFCVVAAAYIHGLRSVTLHALSGPDDHAFILRDCAARLLIAEEAMAGRAAALRAALGEGPLWFSHDVTPGMRAFWAEAEALSPALLMPRAASGDIIRVAYTGGTTGRSKGVLLTDRALLTNTLLWQLAFPWPDEMRYLCVAPMTHGGGSLIAAVLARGGRVVLARGFDPARFCADVARHGVGASWLVPTMLNRLVDQFAVASADLSSLRALVYSAAPAAPARIAQALERLGPILVQAYGHTEAPNALLIMDQADYHEADLAQLAAAGRPMPGLQVAVLDAEGRPLSRGEVGELCVRGPLVMEGYLNRPDETAEVLRGGWLHTGDLARADAEGFVYIVDRARDMLITGGFNVYPRAVEDALAAHPDVAAAAVVGLPDADWGEAVAAAVVARAGTAPEPAALIAHVRDRLGPVAAPKRPRLRTPFGPVFDLHLPLPRTGALHHVGPGSRMRRLEHVNLRVRDPRGLHDLLTGPLGMKLSDRTEALELAWYRAGDGVHHSIAAGQGDRLHHCAFQAWSVADLVRLADTLAALGRGPPWGLGRHGAGDNLFSYYRDPDGAAVECSIGMERIANDAVHRPRVWSVGPDSRVRNLWETSPPPAAFQQAGLPYL